MNFTQAQEYLLSRQIKRETWDLEPTRELVTKLKMPHKRIGKIIHVTGSNGKGSTCAIVANILKTNGYKVGLYTSPHLRRITERIRINYEEIPKDVFASYVSRVRQHVTNQSFFEIMTAISFLYFADKQVDFSVIEVGLGGTLDATNIVESDVSVITNISLEHTARLGSTVEAIAKDKAGIIKQNSYCVTSSEDDSVIAILKKFCEEKNSTLLISRPTDFSRIGLKGEIQKKNAGTAIKIIKALKKQGIEIPKVHIIEGMETVQWPGRFEFLSKNLLVDVAHNPAGAFQLSQEVAKIKGKYDSVIMVFGVLGDKDYKAMLDELVPIANQIILTRPQSHRAADPNVIGRYLAKAFSLDPLIVEKIPMALDRAKRLAGKNDLILVTGSFYTVGAIY